jgi:hypothetical protein
MLFVTSCGLELEHGEPASVLLYFNTTTAWYAVTAALQVVTTSMIVLKLLQHRRALNKRLATSANGLGYISLAGVLAESAALYTISTIAYIPMIRFSDQVQIWWGIVVNSFAVRAFCTILSIYLLMALSASSLTQLSSSFV